MKILETIVHNDYCSIIVSGKYNSTDSLLMFREIMSRCGELNKTKVMIDVQNLEGDIPVIDRYQLGNFINDEKIPFIKIVFLAREDQTKPARIMETVANNRGSYVKVATNLEEALQYFEPAPVRQAN